ncbi:MAG TPA: hypothetical protein VN408_25795 [Actinoplanes sp.]|nr:hypothetical protein [Actinoplanes sp.]
MNDVDDGRRRADAQRFVANLEDEVRRTAPGRPLPVLDTIEGSDTSETVYCMVRLDGLPVRIAITDGWWESVGRDGVAKAILRAHSFAGEKAVIARMLFRRYGRDLPGDSTATRRIADEPPSAAGHTGRNVLDRVHRSLDESSARMTAAMRRFEQIRDAEQREFSGPRGLFTVVVRGPVIEEARVDSFRLTPDSAPVLAADALAALLGARSGHTGPEEG